MKMIHLKETKRRFKIVLVLQLNKDKDKNIIKEETQEFPTLTIQLLTIRKNSKKTKNNKDQQEDKKIEAILKSDGLRVENNKIEIVYNY